MTVGSVIICIILTVLFGGFGFYIAYELHHTADNPNSAIVAIGVTVILLAATWIFPIWFYSNTEAGKRAMKTQDSNFNNGIEREVIVYDMDGDIIQTYTGKFDIEYEDERILFDDENGLRHVIYFKTGTVIVNEIK